ncbi:hypothetical protein SAMN05428950_103228 [Sphingomonas sp. OV641]|uniref:hypothetical protein n=1 Tax=Sphingomonas sp. OV641 TaxID=1881068 RepID=UPI0008BB82D4|nr:hypothetical protein [Sphingomonas sp. OV641]SEJ80057.1 hypothetical protein SAMN05428950_103228 [Sphingomonas sp. OV641]
MSQEPKKSEGSTEEPIWASVFLLAFGCALLLFLIAIEHQNWFELKPATGTAEAMTYASSDRGHRS